MVTHADFQKVLAETQVRSPEHLRLDTQFIIYTEGHAAALTIYTKKNTLSVRFRLIQGQTHLSCPQYRQSDFNDSRLSESASDLVVERKPSPAQTKSWHRTVTSHDSVTSYCSRPSHRHHRFGEVKGRYLA